jgi:hypothetical protein
MGQDVGDGDTADAGWQRIGTAVDAALPSAPVFVARSTDVLRLVADRVPDPINRTAALNVGGTAPSLRGHRANAR